MFIFQDLVIVQPSTNSIRVGDVVGLLKMQNQPTENNKSEKRKKVTEKLHLKTITVYIGENTIKEPNVFFMEH